MDARLLNEGHDENRIVSASDVQLSLLFDNTSFGQQLKKCISKCITSGGWHDQNFQVHEMRIFFKSNHLFMVFLQVQS